MAAMMSRALAFSPLAMETCDGWEGVSGADDCGAEGSGVSAGVVLSAGNGVSCDSGMSGGSAGGVSKSDG
jgi:hypothetical protein